MSGFDLDHNEEVLRNSFLKHFKEAEENVRKVLTSAGYEHIVKSVSVNDYLEGLTIEFEDEIDTKGQNVLQVLAHGGQIKKGDELIPVAPSETIRRYLSTRN
jgi:hypothetical protein